MDIIASGIEIAMLLLLVIRTFRGARLRTLVNGKFVKVPGDAARESHRTASLAELSRLAGGKRINLSLKWEGKTLVVTTDDPAFRKEEV